MSLEILSAVWDLELGRNEKDVLEVLAWHANADGVCWPSKARIMYRTGLSESTVKRTLGNLKKSGLITVEAHATGGRGKAPLYKVKPQKGVRKPPFEEWVKGVRGDIKGVRAMNPQPTIEPSLKNPEVTSITSGANKPAQKGWEELKTGERQAYLVAYLHEAFTKRGIDPPTPGYKSRFSGEVKTYLNRGASRRDFIDAIETIALAKRRSVTLELWQAIGDLEASDAGNGKVSPLRLVQSPNPTPPEAKARVEANQRLSQYAGLCDQWDFTSSTEPPWQILKALGMNDEERAQHLLWMRNVATGANLRKYTPDGEETG